ncbi:hemerythrin domain-containing protein [Aurantiacibacter poecillastricola]|uniref:hemerythrin domain-containing protein n=1 Tax=Aurantiacibacter poecillastricola TaxID=3064385 RepID=UPI00273D40C7|nr:hemerythrin domain-containing protein [Aurantiacibacter sp. 219JJ12-13]MDP5260350.1 hemerythrin domain-containing protein [Aurantiacibacter sp. 219JJ12-13]
MSFLDRIAAAVTPAASDEQRAEARRKVLALSQGEQWLGMIVEQHQRIEGLFAEARSATDVETRQRSVKALATELTGHATAEEAVVYPIVAEDSGKTHAGMAYEEHAMTKIQLAKLERIDPMSEEWSEKLEHIRGAVEQHIYQEEDSWLPDLVEKTSPAKKQLLNQRYAEEYQRYCG